MQASVQIQGLNEIKRALQLMSIEMQDKVLKATHAEAAQPLVARAHALAPVGKTGNLADSIGVIKPSFKKTGEVGLVLVGPRRRAGYKGFHAHLVEYGAVNRKPGGWYAKQRNAAGTDMPKKPFMRPAYEQTKDLLFRNINEIQGRKVIQAMKRAIKQNGGTWTKA